MVESTLCECHIAWSDTDVLLREFLKTTLRILPQPFCDNGLRFIKKISCYKLFCNIISLVEIESTNDRLEGIRENVLPSATRVFLFTF